MNFHGIMPYLTSNLSDPSRIVKIDAMEAVLGLLNVYTFYVISCLLLKYWQTF